MEAELIKVDNGWILTVDNIIYATEENAHYARLSIKNCQAIERGYDLDELFDEVFEKRPKEAQFVDGYDFKQGVMAGFQKALEILGDKKFSEDDVRRAFSAGLSIGYGRQFEIENKQIEIDNYIQSLQQTEWDVEIMMEDSIGIGDKYTPDTKPKLDADNCLILKRK